MKSLLKKLGIVGWKSFWRFVLQFFRFSLVGISNTVLSLAIYYLFLLMNENWYILGNVVGFFISVINACFWSRKFVFANLELNFWKLLFKSYLAYGGSFLLATGLLYVQVEWFEISKAIAPILNLLVTVPMNFIINKLWVFR